MGSCNFSHFPVKMSLHLLLFSLFLFNIPASYQELALPPLPQLPIPLPDPCAIVKCGQGKCVPSNSSLLRFDCDCYTGWKKLKIQIGPLIFPSCVIPNCTVDFQCGNGDPPPPPPPPVAPGSPCSFVWCGDGSCVVNGTGHYCQCNDGSANLFNLPALACFKECYLGADCNHVGFGAPHPPPPPSNSGSTVNGPKTDATNCARTLGALTIIALSAIFLTWI